LATAATTEDSAKPGKKNKKLDKAEKVNLAENNKDLLQQQI
jgi:hypothetical protein